MNELMNGWMFSTNIWMDGWMNGWMDGWMNEWMDGWSNQWNSINLFWRERKVREDKRQASLPDPGRGESEGRERERVKQPPLRPLPFLTFGGLHLVDVTRHTRMTLLLTNCKRADWRLSVFVFTPRVLSSIEAWKDQIRALLKTLISSTRLLSDHSFFLQGTTP